MVIRGKGGRTDRLPLPADVRAAIAGYLGRGRPHSQSREVLLRARAPFDPIDAGTVSSTVRRACRRAGIASMGELVRANWAETSPARGVKDDVRHPMSGQPHPRRDGLHELFARPGAWSPAAQIPGDRLAGIGRNGKLVNTPSLAVHRDQAGSSIEVLQPQRGDLARAQPEPQHQWSGVADRPWPSSAGRQQHKTARRVGAKPQERSANSPTSHAVICPPFRRNRCLRQDGR